MTENQSISFEKKDDTLGSYYIIYEEFLESLMSIPGIILMPIKFISWGLWKFIKHLPEFHWNHMKYAPFTQLYNNYAIAQKECSRWIERKYGVFDPNKNFEKIHFHFLPLIFRVVAQLVFVLNYGFSYIIYFYMKSLSAGERRNIDVIVINNEDGQFLLFSLVFIQTSFLKKKY